MLFQATVVAVLGRERKKFVDESFLNQRRQEANRELLELLQRQIESGYGFD